MGRFGASLAIVSLVVSGLVTAPALYLTYRAGGDPEHLVDGLLRLSWLAPVLWLVGMWLAAERQLARARGILVVQIPLLIGFAVASLAFTAAFADGRIVVSQPARELSRAEEKRLARGDFVIDEVSLGPVAPVARWAHAHLPPHPF